MRHHIDEEWQRNASRIWERSPSQMQQQWQFMQTQFPQANMGMTHSFEKGLKHSDPKDWHVIACGIAALERHPGSLVAVITRNMRDFDRKELRAHGLNLYSPDQLLCLLWPQHKNLMLGLFELFAKDYEEINRPVRNIEEILTQERLFGLRQLYLVEPAHHVLT